MITKQNITFWINKLNINDDDILTYYIYQNDKNGNDETKEIINIRMTKHWKNSYSTFLSLESDTFNKEYELLLYATKSNTINKIYEVMKRIIKAN